jgi:hypothetical protein
VEKRMADYSTRLRKAGAYCFNQESLTHIANSAIKFLGNSPRFTVRLADDHTIEDSDLATLFSDPYVAANRLSNLNWKVFRIALGMKLRKTSHRDS